MSDDSRKIRFGLWCDFRNPAQWRQPADRLYREILDQIAWAENKGFDDVWLSEHHFIEDGYLPSILPIAAAIGARTSHIRIASGVLLMPFHNPIRLAEDIATVDVISGGRFELGVGIGFKGFGVSSKERGARTDQSLEIIRRALAGETVAFKSEFFDFQNLKVTPEPIQKPHPPIWLGGFTPAALRRAVRFGDGFTVPGANRDVYDRYVAEPEKGGHSAMADFYGIGSLEEARAYLAHPVLGPRLDLCTRLVLKIENNSLHQIFGSPDDMKFRSSMTVFALAASDEGRPFRQALDHWCDGRMDERTRELLENSGPRD